MVGWDLPIELGHDRSPNTPHLEATKLILLVLFIPNFLAQVKLLASSPIPSICFFFFKKSFYIGTREYIFVLVPATTLVQNSEGTLDNRDGFHPLGHHFGQPFDGGPQNSVNSKP